MTPNSLGQKIQKRQPSLYNFLLKHRAVNRYCELTIAHNAAIKNLNLNDWVTFKHNKPSETLLSSFYFTNDKKKDDDFWFNLHDELLKIEESDNNTP